MDYEELLKRGLSHITRIDKGRRFEMPTAEMGVRGQKSAITNFVDIAERFRRPPADLVKFLSKEMATYGTLQGRELVLLGNVSLNLVNKKIADYAAQFVFCQECKQPDTKIVKEGKADVMVCEACGARRFMKQK